MKKLLKSYKDFSLWQVKDEKELFKIDHFVLNVYYKHHLKQEYPKHELQKMIFEDTETMHSSMFYVIYDNKGEIVGTIKSQTWDKKAVLSMEKDFNVDIKYLISSLPDKPKEIIHVGRFAINQEKIRSSNALKRNRISIMKMLLLHALLPVNKCNTNMALCECDEKLNFGLKTLGINTEILGEAKVHLGSTTIPICSYHSGIKNFINENKHLCYV